MPDSTVSPEQVFMKNLPFSFPNLPNSWESPSITCHDIVITEVDRTKIKTSFPCPRNFLSWFWIQSFPSLSLVANRWWRTFPHNSNIISSSSSCCSSSSCSSSRKRENYTFPNVIYFHGLLKRWPKLSHHVEDFHYNEWNKEEKLMKILD